MIARRAVVSGRVQGVGFRFFAERAAREAGVAGWVRNRSDGTVETVVEGPESAVGLYLQRLRKGSVPRSRDLGRRGGNPGGRIRIVRDHVSDLRSFVRDVPDFPSPGILFRDITPLLASPEAFAAAVRAMAEPFRKERIAKVLGIEARGFMFGAAIARELDLGFVPARKPGKLPARPIRASYGLEYGKDNLELHADAFARESASSSPTTSWRREERRRRRPSSSKGSAPGGRDHLFHRAREVKRPFEARLPDAPLRPAALSGCQAVAGIQGAPEVLPSRRLPLSTPSGLSRTGTISRRFRSTPKTDVRRKDLGRGR